MAKFNKKKLPSRHTSLGADRAPKVIVEQEKNNYNNLKNDIEKISVTIKGI